jgi:3-phenylpropionate/cinnamic acid dioxygenase small subunit
MTTATEQAMPGEMVRREVEEFLYLEAQLLDDQRYDAWLELWAPGELNYWLPMRHGETDRSRLSIICDDRGMLEKRIERLLDDWVLIQEPRSRMNRIVGNIRMVSTGVPLEVRSVVSLVEFRRSQYIPWSATQLHRFERIEGRLRLREKRVDLINADAEIRAVAFLF